MPERNKLVYTPDWSSVNPYQKLLYVAIEAAGMDCSGLDGHGFTFTWLWNNRKLVQYIHLHWLFGVYDPDRKGLTIRNLACFVGKLIAVRILGYRVIWTVHNLVSHEPSNLKLEIFIRKITAFFAQYVVAHCEYAKKMVCELWRVNADKVFVIPHGSYLGYYPNDVSRSQARHKLNIPDEQFVFLFFGLVRSYKGIKELLLSYSSLKSTNNIGLVIAGTAHDESVKRDLEGMTAEGISLHLRHINEDEVQLFFNACDVVVLPYLDILTSGAAVLAISFGRPVIAPAKGCIPELLNEANGFLYHKQNELTAAMAKAATCEDLSEMSNNALTRARELQWCVIVADHYSPMLGIEPKASFSVLAARKKIFLYAGDITQDGRHDNYIGLSLSQENFQHIKHDVADPLPLPDVCVDIYQSEDVFEHILPEKLTHLVNEIYRVLKPGGLFRLSLPDYRCDILYGRSLKDEYGKLVFDPAGGGEYVDGKVVAGGHLWFPKYETVREILSKTHFKEIFFYHYYDEAGNPVTESIDYILGYIRRTPDHDERVQNPYRPMSIVVDCRK